VYRAMGVLSDLDAGVLYQQVLQSWDQSRIILQVSAPKALTLIRCSAYF
jgi:hypothetical protein